MLAKVFTGCLGPSRPVPRNWKQHFRAKPLTLALVLALLQAKHMGEVRDL